MQNIPDDQLDKLLSETEAKLRDTRARTTQINETIATHETVIQEKYENLESRTVELAGMQEMRPLIAALASAQNTLEELETRQNTIDSDAAERIEANREKKKEIQRLKNETQALRERYERHVKRNEGFVTEIASDFALYEQEKERERNEKAGEFSEEIEKLKTAIAQLKESLPAGAEELASIGEYDHVINVLGRALE